MDVFLGQRAIEQPRGSGFTTQCRCHILDRCPICLDWICKTMTSHTARMAVVVESADASSSVDATESDKVKLQGAD